MVQLNERVGAIQSSENGVVNFYGYGIYQGETVPPKNVGGLNIDIPNPTIRLDSGDLVYGCECWWGSEEKIKKMLSGAKIVTVKPNRSKYNAAKRMA